LWGKYFYPLELNLFRNMCRIGRQRLSGDLMVTDLRKVRIMLVEDNIDDFELTRIVLRRHFLDKHLHLATDGSETLKCLERLVEDCKDSSDLPDLILVDIGLPGMNGLELLEKLKNDTRFSHIPVVILTGSHMSEHIQKSYDLGAVTYLVKPVSEDDLMMTLSYLT